MIFFCIKAGFRVFNVAQDVIKLDWWPSNLDLDSDLGFVNLSCENIIPYFRFMYIWTVHITIAYNRIMILFSY